MDKINIVSSQAVLEVSSFNMDTCSMSSSPLVSSFVKNRLFKNQERARHQWTAVSIHSHYGFVCGWHDAAWQTRSCNPQDRDMDCLEAAGWVQESLTFLDAAVQLLDVHGVVCWCTVWLSCWNTKSLPETLRIAGSSMTSLWRGEAASNKSVRDITRISYFVLSLDLMMSNLDMFRVNWRL